MSDSTGGQPAEGAAQAQPLSPFMYREPAAGKHHYLKATDFLGNRVDVEVHAQLTPAHVSRAASCSVFVTASTPGLRVNLPDMTASEAQALAHALLMAARDAERIDGGVVQ